MEYCDYISRIRFRLIEPQTPMLPLGFQRHTQWMKFGAWFENFNTRLPRDGRRIKHQLGDLCYIPKMSTLAIGAMINKAVAEMPEHSVYLNIGVWQGFTFLAGMIDNADKTCIGVDNFSEFGGPKEDFCERFHEHKSPNHHFYEMDYVDYFREVHKEPIGVFIYDGEHSYENQLMALRIAEPYLIENCIILVDDTNYDEVRQANEDFIATSTYDYRIIFDQTTRSNYHPTFWNGVTVFQRA